MISFRPIFAQLENVDMGWRCGTPKPNKASLRLAPVFLALALGAPACFGNAAPAAAQDDARTRQLRLLCAQLSGDLTDPGGMAAFRRCLTAHDPSNEIRRDNNVGAGVVAADRPGAIPPKGFGHDSRSPLADGVQHFAAQDGGFFYVIDKDGRLWRWNPATRDPHVIDNEVAGFALVDNTHLLVLGTDGRLWLEAVDTASRTPVDEKVASFQPMGAIVYVRGSDGKLWRETGNPGRRALVDQQVASFQAIDASLVYVLSIGGKLWRERVDARDRNEIANSITAYQYLPDGNTTYVLAQDGALWRQEGDNAKPEQIDRGVAAFQALNLHLAYVLGRDGRLWLEIGNRDHAVLGPVDKPVLAPRWLGGVTPTWPRGVTR
jgi:hypothetical protein